MDSNPKMEILSAERQRLQAEAERIKQRVAELSAAIDAHLQPAEPQQQQQPQPDPPAESDGSADPDSNADCR